MEKDIPPLSVNDKAVTHPAVEPLYDPPLHRVAILSTGNELIAPGQPMQPGLVYDSNATIVADMANPDDSATQAILEFVARHSGPKPATGR